MNWDDLRVLLALSRGRTLTAAADVLCVTHTTVSRRLRACEETLGVRLFDRMPDGLHATAAGQELIALAESMESEVLSTQGRIMGRDVQIRGPLRVSTLDILFAAAREAFASFISRYPSIEMTVTTPMQPVSLSRREADVALRLSPSPPEGLVGRRVGRLTFAVYVSPTLADRVGENAPYSAYPWIGMDQQLSDVQWMDAWLAHHAHGAQIVARIDENAMLMRQMVVAGVGAFFLPVWEGDTLGLQRVGPPLADIKTDVWLLTHPDLRHAGRVRAFLDHMAEVLPQLAPFVHSTAK
jgi:DNA-binding transcriptional LysR family regulator